MRDWVRALEATAPIAAQPRRLLADIVEHFARQQGDAPALIAATGSLDYRALAERANRYARWALQHGLHRGDTVALLMPNQPDYVAIWLGLGRVGVIAALINTNLRGAALAHCVGAAAPKHIIVAADLAADLTDALAHGSASPIAIWSHGGDADSGHRRIDRTIEQFDGATLQAFERNNVTISDTALYIYTSGTTGLPKAARISHRRTLEWSFWFAGLIDATPHDRMYDCLPLYHSVGGVVAIGALLVRGGSVLLREKFSAQRFWDDIVDGDCTLFQYIGELARYLTNAPPNPRERAHRLRLVCGNGLRSDVWEKFQSRFAIPRILEFYAATEGNVSLYNVEGKVGAIGRVPPFLAHRAPLVLVRIDGDTGAPVRDQTGCCQACETGEAGEAMGRISGSGSQAGVAFEGYSDAADSERKILRDVFEPGDAWYRTGDLMRRDAAGFYYFVDRIGDTYRWKGENVSTAEVEAAIAAFPGVADVAVYGVRVPGTDGAAGMAAIVGTIDLQGLHAHIAQALPAYARPLFLRLCSAIAATGTFKHATAALKREGFDPASMADAILFDDPQAGAYVQLDATLYSRIVNGAIKI
jgi:fatty-acyl-CoA synthase